MQCCSVNASMIYNTVPTFNPCTSRPDRLDLKLVWCKALPLAAWALKYIWLFVSFIGNLTLFPQTYYIITDQMSRVGFELRTSENDMWIRYQYLPGFVAVCQLCCSPWPGASLWVPRGHTYLYHVTSALLGDAQGQGLSAQGSCPPSSRQGQGRYGEISREHYHALANATIMNIKVDDNENINDSITLGVWKFFVLGARSTVRNF